MPPKELLDFRYRERFGLTQQELLEEPQDIYNINLAIISKINEIASEQPRHRANAEDRIKRMG